MENVQNNTFHTKMPGHTEGTKVAGALTLAADEHHPLHFSQAEGEGKMLTITGRV